MKAVVTCETENLQVVLTIVAALKYRSSMVNLKRALHGSGSTDLARAATADNQCSSAAGR